MRRLDLTVQHFAVQGFILVIVFVCAIFLVVSGDILQKIDDESLLSRQFLIAWLACKSDALAYLALPTLRSKAELTDELSACGAFCARLDDSPLVRAMRMLEGSKHPGTELGPSWSALRPEVERLIDAPKIEDLGRDELVPALARASFLESAVKERIDLIAKFEQDQRRAVAILQQSLIIAAIALVGLSVWASRLAVAGRKSQSTLGAKTPRP
jgi:hypothetical protein